MQRRNKKSKFGSSGFAPKSETGERIGKIASALANRMGANIQESKGSNFNSTPSGTISTSNIAGLGSSLDSAGKDNTVFNTGAVLPKNTDFLKSNEKRAGFGFKLSSAEFASLSKRVKAAGIKTGDSPAEITAAINKVKQGEVRDQIKQIAKNFKTDVQFGEYLVDLQKELEIVKQYNKRSEEYLTKLSKDVFDQKTKMLGDIWTKGIAYDKYDFGKDFEDINNKYKDDPMSKGVAFSGKDAMEPPARSRAARTPPFRFPPIPPPANPNLDPFNPINDPKPYQPIPNNPTHPIPDMPNINPRPGVGPGNKPLPLFPKPDPTNPLSPREPGITPYRRPTVPNQPGYPQGIPFIITVGGVALVIMCIMGACYVINKHQEQPDTPPVPNPPNPSPSPTGSEPQRNPSRGPTRYQGVDNQTP